MIKIIIVLLFVFDIYASSVPKLQVGNRNYIQKIEFSEDNSKIITYSYQSINYWDSKILKLLYTIPQKYTFYEPNNKCESEDNTLKAYSNHWNKLVVEDINNTIKEYPLEYKARTFNPCAIAKSKNNIALGGQRLNVLDLHTGEVKISPTLNPMPIGLIVLKHDLGLLIGDNQYIAWDLKLGKELWRNIGDKTQCHDCSPDPSAVILENEKAIVLPSYCSAYEKVHDNDNGFLYFDMKTGKYTPMSIRKLGSLAVSPDNQLLAVIGFEGEMQLYNLPSLKLLQSLKAPSGINGPGFAQRSYIKFKNNHEIYVKKPGSWEKNVFIINLEGNTTRFEDFNLSREFFGSFNINEKVNVEIQDDGQYKIKDINKNNIASFVSLEEGEWIIITEYGYFNASSKRALNNLYIFESDISSRSLNENEVKHYYRPDIVSLILQQKPIAQEKKNKKNFKLPDQIIFKNKFID